MSNERKTLKCSVCAKVEGEFHLCANCQSSVYCSKECQKSDWKTHYKTCEKALEQYGVGDGTKRKDAPSSSLTSTSSSTTTTTTTVTKNNDDDDNDKNNNDDIEDADDNDDDVNDKQNASETTATVTIPSSSTNSTTTTTGTTSTNEKPSKKLKTGPSNKPVKEEGVPFITSSEGQHTLMDFPNGEAVYQIFHPNFPDVKFLNSEPTYKGLNEKYGLGIVNMLPNGQPEPDRKKPVDFKNPIFPFINVFGRWFDSVIRAYEYAKLASIGLVQIYDYAIAPLTLETAVVFVNKKDEQIEKDTPTFKFDSATGKTLLLKEAETSGADQLKLLAGGKPTQGQITSLENYFWSESVKLKALRSIIVSLYHPRYSNLFAHLLLKTDHKELYLSSLHDDFLGIHRNFNGDRVGFKGNIYGKVLKEQREFLHAELNRLEVQTGLNLFGEYYFNTPFKVFFFDENVKSTHRINKEMFKNVLDRNVFEKGKDPRSIIIGSNKTTDGEDDDSEESKGEFIFNIKITTKKRWENPKTLFYPIRFTRKATYPTTYLVTLQDASDKFQEFVKNFIETNPVYINILNRLKYNMEFRLVSERKNEKKLDLAEKKFFEILPPEQTIVHYVNERGMPVYTFECAETIPLSEDEDEF